MSETTSPLPSAEPAGPSPRERTRQKRVRLAVAVVLIVAAAVGLRHYLHTRNHESTDDASLEGHVIPVSPRVPGHVLRVHVTDNQEVKAGDLLAELDPTDFQVRLDQARAALRVAQARTLAARKTVDLTRVTSGASVEEATAGVTRARSGVETAWAQVAAARSRVDQAVAQRAAVEASADQAAAEVVAAEAEAGRAGADLRRYQDAIQSRGVSRQQLDLATATATSARARLDATRKKVAAARAQAAEAAAAEKTAREGLRQAEAQIGEAQARVGEARGRLASADGAPHQVAASRSQADASSAQIEQATAAVREAELALSYTRILAPEAGRVTKKAAEPGGFVQVGQPLLAIVPRTLWVVANFKESQISRMRPGQRATVTVDAFPDVHLKAHVDSIQAGTGSRFSLLPPENATGNYVKVVQRVPVKIVFDEAPPRELPLGPGMSVEPEVEVR
ncbi:MAG: HlyD family secretion protein [Deltaproteobacteria bacterium]|nr:HlyD family secretion protein [Deltaproteobacteria bacterium]